MEKKKRTTCVNEGAVIRVPGSSRENKTGSWRSFRPVNTDKCTACSICTWYCPENCITIEEKNGKKQAVIDYDYCKGCLVCVNVCPVKSIRAEKEE